LSKAVEKKRERLQKPPSMLLFEKTLYEHRKTVMYRCRQKKREKKEKKKCVLVPLSVVVLNDLEESTTDHNGNTGNNDGDGAGGRESRAGTLSRGRDTAVGAVTVGAVAGDGGTGAGGHDGAGGDTSGDLISGDGRGTSGQSGDGNEDGGGTHFDY